MRIGVDLMGNENSPETLLRAIQKAPLPEGVSTLLIGTPELKSGALPYVAAPEVIELGDSPLLALRRKKQASMLVGLRLLKEGKIDALVTAGNTGVLVAGAKTILGYRKGISRAALLTLVPTKKEPLAVLDVGANVEVNASHLVQFAEMGVEYQKARGVKNPAIALLNMGIEPYKGTKELQTAHQKLLKSKLNFIGNIEGNTAFDGKVDVLVTSGFTGNIFLKTAEGIAEMAHMKHNAYPGAFLMGAKGVLVKCHSFSPPDVFIETVLGLAKENFGEKLKEKLR
jgi:phosphate acyltransferase